MPNRRQLFSDQLIAKSLSLLRHVPDDEIAQWIVDMINAATSDNPLLSIVFEKADAIIKALQLLKEQHTNESTSDRPEQIQQ